MTFKSVVIRKSFFEKNPYFHKNPLFPKKSKTMVDEDMSESKMQSKGSCLAPKADPEKSHGAKISGVKK